MALIAPSLLAADYLKIGEEVRRAKEAGADLLHYDVMDGTFVNSITFGYEMLKRIDTIGLPLDVHFMITRPELHVREFVEAGAKMLTVHVEAAGDKLREAVYAIKAAGAKAGVSLRPATDIHTLDAVVDILDYVLIMGVVPGYGGQKMLPDSLNRIRTMKEYLKERNPRAEIEFDGGITLENVKDVVDAGVDIVVAGSALFKAEDMKAAISAMRGT